MFANEQKQLKISFLASRTLIQTVKDISKPTRDDNFLDLLLTKNSKQKTVSQKLIHDITISNTSIDSMVTKGIDMEILTEIGVNSLTLGQAVQGDKKR